MTKTMNKKVMKIVNEYHDNNERVHNARFHHYGNDYRIEERENGTLVLYRHNPHGIMDFEVETFNI